MSNPDSPPRTPTTPTASDAGGSPPEPIATGPEAGSNGKTDDVSQTSAHAPEPSDEGAHEEAGAAQHGEATTEEATSQQEEESAAEPAHDDATPSPSGAPGEKKRRRRRRRKKPGGGAAAEGTSPEASDVPTEAGPAEETAEPSADAPPAERKDRKKERKHGPPRERPPVTLGDIVFGKILEITDEAIFVDIPGKAHAIFDRAEMLLPDDDEPPRQPPHSASPEPQPTPGLSSALSLGSSAPTTTSETAEVTSPVDGVAELEQASEEGETVAPADASPAIEPVASKATEEPSAPAPTPEPPREPKVPRVILEVGADFIAVVHSDGARGGLVVLTHHPNRAERTKPLLEKAFQEKTTTLGLVTGVIKGGIEVDVDGLRAFAPGSHMDLRLGADLSYLLGKRLPFFVTQYAKRGRDVVLSRKSIIEDEAKKMRVDALAKMKVGQELDGVVRSVVPFGAFVDVGGIEGLVPLQEMSHNRADGPSDIFKAGEPTRVKVIKIDDRGKVWLSRKATIPDPWQEVAQKYAQGTRHSGKVVRLQPFGAFVELEPGVDGLIHTQDLSIKRIEAPGDVVKVNDPIEVVVAHLDPSQHKIALHPAPQGDQANEPAQRVAPHKAVKARIVAIESGGLLVRVLGVTGRHARGYITSAGTGTPRGTELRKAFNVGQEVEAKVVEVDPRRGEVKLSIKALSEEQERSAYQQYRQQLKAEARFTLADLITKNKGGSR
jgi:small subunit ribosomal protein S1